MPEEKRFLGIDPGIETVGWGFIEIDSKGVIVDSSIASGIIKTSRGLSIPDRLISVEEGLEDILKKFKPECVGIETLFFNKNIKTAITVAEARGVIMATCRKKGCSIIEISPLQVKEGITGYGRAEKSQLQEMLKKILHLVEIPKPDDAADGLAIAYYLSQTSRMRNLMSN